MDAPEVGATRLQQPRWRLEARFGEQARGEGLVPRPVVAHENLVVPGAGNRVPAECRRRGNVGGIGRWLGAGRVGHEMMDHIVLRLEAAAVLEGDLAPIPAVHRLVGNIQMGDEGSLGLARRRLEGAEAFEVEVADMPAVRRIHRYPGHLVEAHRGKQRHQEAWLVRPVADVDIEEAGRVVMRVALIRSMGVADCQTQRCQHGKPEIRFHCLTPD